MQLEFEIKPLGCTFLDEIGVAYTFFNGADKAQAVLARAFGEAAFFQRGPGLGHAFAQGGFGTGSRVPGHHVQAVGQCAGDPAAANDTAAQGREGFDVSDKGHGQFLIKIRS